ncbi:phage tail protein [Pseudonocardia endophytica]|uniref:Phage tail-like protein n=1 Tax=Pseudonocardia endophytica TaxID=401976 RepID=A0A4V2PI16_PSEEN|nr:phage tail protein [Pseudonocardia endophytica]TCK22866.1 phage tail-like protein [Pseudonocardia endophytica]
MTAPGYERFLPPVVRARADAAGIDLDGLLQAFREALTGPSAPDAARPAPGERIDRLDRLFDPWSTDPELLDWLAGWVSFAVPPAWDDNYQRRRAVAEIAGVHAHRGRREGMARYLDLHAVAAVRPRVAIDDGARILFARPRPDVAVEVHALLSSGPLLERAAGATRVVLDGLVQPTCVTLTPELDLLLADLGGPAGATQVPPGLWRVDRTGRVEHAGAPPLPRRLGPVDWAPPRDPSDPPDPGDVPAPHAPVGVAVVAGPTVYLLDADPEAATPGRLLRLTGERLDVVDEVARWDQLGLVRPVAMVALAEGDLVVLDAPDGDAALVEIDPSAIPAGGTPPGRHTLAGLEGAVSLLALGDGSLVVGALGGDGGPAELVRVSRPSWTATRLLSGVDGERNPIVAPTAVVEEDSARLLVLDVGLRPLAAEKDNPFLRDVARPALVHRVDLSTSPPTVSTACRPGRLVHPTGMVLHDGTLYLCDPGEPEITSWPRRPWRTTDAEFGVLVHFAVGPALSRPPTAEQVEMQKAIRAGIERIVADQQPARALPSVTTAV